MLKIHAGLCVMNDFKQNKNALMHVIKNTDY